MLAAYKVFLQLTALPKSTLLTLSHVDMCPSVSRQSRNIGEHVSTNVRKNHSEARLPSSWWDSTRKNPIPNMHLQQAGPHHPLTGFEFLIHMINRMWLRANLWHQLMIFMIQFSVTACIAKLLQLQKDMPKDMPVYIQRVSISACMFSLPSATGSVV